MSRPEQSPDHGRGPSLVLMFTLVVLALAGAIGFALLIVFPFWSRSR